MTTFLVLKKMCLTKILFVCALDPIFDQTFYDGWKFKDGWLAMEYFCILIIIIAPL